MDHFALIIGELCNIVVSSPEMAKEVMKTHDTIFANRPFLLAAQMLSYDSTNIGFSSYVDYWRQLGKMLKKHPHNQEHKFNLNSSVNLDLCKHLEENKEHQYLTWFGQIAYVYQSHQQAFPLRKRIVTLLVSVTRKPQKIP